MELFGGSGSWGHVMGREGRCDMPSGGRGEQSGVTPPGRHDIIQQANSVVLGGLGWPQPKQYPGSLPGLPRALLGNVKWPLKCCTSVSPLVPQG